MNDEIAVIVNSVSKQFTLPHEKKTSVKSIFSGMLKANSESTEQHALKDINIEIKKGEFFFIFGQIN